MPFTAFHPALLWLLWMKFPRRIDFVALTVGAVIPDLFEPFIALGLVDPSWPVDRDWTHSLLGALTLDAVLALAATFLVARPLLAWADRRWPSGLWSRFAGLEFRRRASWGVTLLSLWAGTLSHVLIDVPFHAEVRLFRPLGPEILLFHFQSQWVADLVSTVLFGPPFVVILYWYWWRPSRSGPRSTT